MDAKTLWQDHKLFFILFGVVIVIVKFRNVLIDLLVSNSKWIFDNATKKSLNLSGEEKKYNDEADKLIQGTEENQGSKVDSDWYKK